MSFFGEVPPSVQGVLQRDLRTALALLPSSVTGVQLYAASAPFAHRLTLELTSGRQLTLDVRWPDQGERVAPTYAFSLRTSCCNAETIIELRDFQHHCSECNAVAGRVFFHGYLNSRGRVWNTYYTTAPLKAMLDSALDPLVAELEVEAVEALMESFLRVSRANWYAGRAFTPRSPKPPAPRADGRDRRFRRLAHAGDSPVSYTYEADEWVQYDLRGRRCEV